MIRDSTRQKGLEKKERPLPNSGIPCRLQKQNAYTHHVAVIYIRHHADKVQLKIRARQYLFDSFY